MLFTEICFFQKIEQFFDNNFKTSFTFVIIKIKTNLISLELNTFYLITIHNLLLFIKYIKKKRGHSCVKKLRHNVFVQVLLDYFIPRAPFLHVIGLISILIFYSGSKDLPRIINSSITLKSHIVCMNHLQYLPIFSLCHVRSHKIIYMQHNIQTYVYKTFITLYAT